jgi:uncharacterized protein
MAANVIVDSGFLVALLSRRDTHHRWAVGQSSQLPLPWKTCEAVLSETFYLLDTRALELIALLHRRAVVCAFQVNGEIDKVLELMATYEDAPMSFADACLVRMTEMLADPIVVTLDTTHFRVYRRNRNEAIPCVMPN